MCKISTVLKEKHIMNFDHQIKQKNYWENQQFMDDHLYEGKNLS